MLRSKRTALSMRIVLFLLLSSKYGSALHLSRIRCVVSMVDSSSVAWLKSGQRVRVVEPVLTGKGVNLLGEEGIVTSAWEKCEEDPHCCCAELAEETAAVTVQLDNFSSDRLFYFAESELQRVHDPKPSLAAGIAATVIPKVTTALSDSGGGLSLGVEDDVLYAYALVLPLISYKIAAVSRGQKLLPSLDASIALAVIAAIVYCNFLRI